MSEIMVPPRKRRRPALSCVECRRRKIKCDRRMPCSHCMQLKSTICTFPETHADVPNRRNVPKPSANSLSVNRPLQGAQFFGTSSPLPNLPSLAILPRLGDGPHSEEGSWGPTPAGSSHTSPSEPNVQNLVDRSKDLEQTTPSPVSPDKKKDQVMSVLGAEFSSFGDVMLQVGSSNPTRSFEPAHLCPNQDLKSDPHRTQFFGQSHWMNTFNMFSRKCRYEDENGKVVTGFETDEVREVFQKCRKLNQAMQARLHRALDVNTNFRDQIPPQEVADELVDLYFRTHESIYRILHIPSFRKEYTDYWKYPEGTSTSVIVKILLVMSIGTCFYQGPRQEDIRLQAKQWVSASQSWAAALFDKEQLTLATIQINCLLLIARQTNSIGVDLIWIPTGNLLRIAFSMGFHRDPKHFPKLSIFVAEMRRRIWATVLEMTVQNSIDLGMPPLISSNDFDTEPPSNINDDDISEGTKVIPTPKPIQVFTQTSIQISLVKSVRTRLEIVHFVNSFHSEPSYDDVLRLGQEISKACNDASRLIQSYPAYLPRPTAFHSSLLDIYIRRFVLEVHRPFFVRSQTDPRYYFSRKVCIENALELFSHSGAKDLPTNHEPHIRDDYESLKTVGGGLFKTIFFLAITIITVELMLLLDEDIASGLPPTAQAKIAREPLYEAVKNISKLATDRVRMGEDNYKGPVFFNAATAVIHAKASGISPDKIVPDAAKRSANECLEILKGRMSRAAPDEPQVEGQPSSLAGAWSDGTGETDFGFDLMMPDVDIMNFGMQEGFGFEMQDSWLCTGWDTN
ncbi:hypothetical protein L207DRAFT_628704 [Hyaloscypha variabilis F]|uniref:Zn(2)-C6 fungal-type domain-containing protein n=1 Tax=Hyaloscypha variabilis (strain UAMH 11265 / GT02V1 / F) TaxID=1149755 RepID=A0A2J6S5R3_HYAVF|nr:hypothetical protein L207DRAFT_628704 [Hyaloscypha variabilis F]